MALAMVRGAGATLRETAEFDLQVYRDQLKEVVLAVELFNPIFEVLP